MRAALEKVERLYGELLNDGNLAPKFVIINFSNITQAIH